MHDPDHPNFKFLGIPSGKVAVSGALFEDVDCLIPLSGNAYKATEGIRNGDLAMVSFTRQPKPGDLVVADTPSDGRRLMRIISAASPFLRSDNPQIQDVSLDEEGVRIIGTVIDTMRNPPILSAA